MRACKKTHNNAAGNKAGAVKLRAVKLTQSTKRH